MISLESDMISQFFTWFSMIAHDLTHDFTTLSSQDFVCFETCFSPTEKALQSASTATTSSTTRPLVFLGQPVRSSGARHGCNATTLYSLCPILCCWISPVFFFKHPWLYIYILLLYIYISLYITIHHYPMSFWFLMIYSERHIRNPIPKRKIHHFYTHLPTTIAKLVELIGQCLGYGRYIDLVNGILWGNIDTSCSIIFLADWITTYSIHRLSKKQISPSYKLVYKPL